MTQLTEDTVREVAILHQELLDQSFLSTLGHGFLVLLYAAINKDENSRIIVRYGDRGEVIGFVTGGKGLAGIYRQLLQRPVALTWSLRRAITSPRGLKGIVEILISTARSGERSRQVEVELPAAELYFIAVDTAYQGSGIASDLYFQLMLEFKGMGVKAFKVLVGDSLDRAHQFYAKMGAERIGSASLHSDRTSSFYLQNVPSA